MRAIYFAVLLFIVWGAFYAMLPSLSEPKFILTGFGIAAFATILISSIVAGRKE